MAINRTTTSVQHGIKVPDVFKPQQSFNPQLQPGMSSDVLPPMPRMMPGTERFTALEPTIRPDPSGALTPLPLASPPATLKPELTGLTESGRPYDESKWGRFDYLGGGGSKFVPAVLEKYLDHSRKGGASRRVLDDMKRRSRMRITPKGHWETPDAYYKNLDAAVEAMRMKAKRSKTYDEAKSEAAIADWARRWGG